MATERGALVLELVLAARAAGFEVLGDEHPADGLNVLVNGRVYLWRPRVDDGDALRLATKLELVVAAHYVTGIDRKVGAGVWRHPYLTSDEPEWWQAAHEDDYGAAVRLAIVRAAAEIGKGMG